MIIYENKKMDRDSKNIDMNISKFKIFKNYFVAHHIYL